MQSSFLTNYSSQVCTSAPEMNGHPTGLWLEELAAPYFAFESAGYETVIASPSGGPIPIDKNCMSDPFFTDVAKKFMHEADAVGKLSHSMKVEEIDCSSIDVLYLTGGHGTCVDFINNPSLASKIQSVIKSQDKVLTAVCHGVIGLVDCKNDDGTPIVSGRTVTGFADSEEEAVGLTKAVPFLLETKLKEQGASYEKTGDWGSKVCVDGKLITGQNPQSSEECAKAVISMLTK